MFNSQRRTWSDDPNAPKIPPAIYYFEKVWFAGNFVTAIPYGIVIVLFFKCMAALFDPAHRRGEPIKWGLVTYTVVMFSLVTIGTALQLNTQSISYIDNRQFPGVEGVLAPGPITYQDFIAPKAITIVQNAVFILSNWLADGLLLYRCYIVYSMNLWVIAFPCLMYLGSMATGIAFVYQNAHTTGTFWSTLPHFTISLSLNTLLTIMIAVRLILHARNTRAALGITGIGGMCRAIVVMLVESCALYAVSSLLVIGPLGAGNPIWSLFVAIVGEIQVIAPLLVILRVANKSALTSNTIASGRIGEFKARSRVEPTGDGGAISCGDHVNSADEGGMNSGELAVGVATVDIVDIHQDGIQASPNPGTLHS